MKRRLIALALLPTLAFGASALAKSTPVSAALAAPVAKEKTVIAGGGAWRCAQTTCRLASDNQIDAQMACRDLVRQVGEVTRFGSADQPLSAERLARCNRK